MRMLETSTTFLRKHFSRRIFTIPTTTLNRLISDHLLRQEDDGLVEARKLFNQNQSSLNNSTWNMMIKAYLQRGLILEAHQVFDQMPVRDLTSWNTIFISLKKNRDPERVLRLFITMRRSGISPDEFTISSVIDSVSRSGFKVLITQLHSLAIRLGLNVNAYAGSAFLRFYTNVKSLEKVFEEISTKDVVSWNVLITGYMKLGLMEVSEKVFDEMPERNNITWHTMLIGYINNSKIDKAKIFFDQMSSRNVFSWTVMINGYVQTKEYKLALNLFREMVELEYHKPSHYTFSSVLKASSSSSSLILTGKVIHSMIVKRGMGIDVVLSTSLIDMYAKSGEILDSSRVFELMSIKNPASWNSMIGGFARHGLGNEALMVFEKMIKSGYKPDQVTFINVLSACAHSGLVEEGERLFVLMNKKFGIIAEKEHYACMVDLFGRSGQLVKAERLIKDMPLKADVVIWGALLGACGLHSCLELGEFAAEEISRLRKEHPASFDVLCRVYGENGDWSSVMELRKLMRVKNVKKQDASSWIESSF